jgi:predicted phosphoribosyltransferase
MSVIVTRKIGYPRQPEVGVAAERAELNRRVQVCRAGRPLPQLAMPRRFRSVGQYYRSSASSPTMMS